MQASVPELTDLSKEPRAHVRAVRPGLAEARHLRRQLPAGPAAGRARRALHPALPPRLGPSRRPAARHPTAVPARPTSRRAALIQDLKAARPARRHAGHLGRRIRPDRLLPGQADGRRLRPRPSPALLHDLDGRRRHQAGHHASARPTTTRYNVAQDPVHVHDLNATILQLPGHRPHAADLQVPGPPLPPDRHRRPHRPESAQLRYRSERVAPLALLMSRHADYRVP